MSNVMNRSQRVLGQWALIAVLVALNKPASAQVDFEQPPINYLSAEPSDPISKLQNRIDAGEIRLEHERTFGYLRSVLNALAIPQSSQTLVFSKTSFQLRLISPHSPRAIYFSDDVYIGSVRGGEVLEISAVDPRLGANFYTLSQDPKAQPQFRRQTHDCLQCHGSTLTKGVPGHMVRSVYAKSDGQPSFGAGTFLIDHSSPLSERWGGWYVTGKHGTQRHLGNLFVTTDFDPRTLDLDATANQTDLSPYFNTKSYAMPHSDIVALMVLEHQTMMHNLITRANFLTQFAIRDSSVMNKALERPEDYVSESTVRRIQSAAEPLVKYMLFSGEAKLTDSISGTSGFADEFATRGARDKQGRSLREFDLKSRLFRYPCSYLIYSEAFDELPRPVKTRVYDRLWEVLSGADTSKDFEHLTTSDRQAIREILLETKPDFASSATKNR